MTPVAPLVEPAKPDRRRNPRRAHRLHRRPEERVVLLGETMDLVRPEEVLHHIDRWIESGRRTLVANHNLHSLYLLSRLPELRRFFNRAELVEVDSTPLVKFAALIGLNSKGFHRCTYLDWRDQFWSMANRKRWRIAYVGGADGVAAEAARRLGQTYPDAELRTWSGYFDARPNADDNRRLLADLAAFKPQVLFVGMGMPRQELWISRNFDRLPEAVVLSVGAAFDYEAGVQKAAPRWMGRWGVEWLFRLIADPRRLFSRYCLEPWCLIPLFARDVVGAFLPVRVANGEVARRDSDVTEGARRSQPTNA